MLNFTKVQPQIQEVRLPASNILPENSNGQNDQHSSFHQLMNLISPLTSPLFQQADEFEHEQQDQLERFQNIRHLSN